MLIVLFIPSFNQQPGVQDFADLGGDLSPNSNGVSVMSSTFFSKGLHALSVFWVAAKMSLLTYFTLTTFTRAHSPDPMARRRSPFVENT